MSKNILILLIVQFLSAFADNAILFTVIAIVLQTSATASWYIPALQSVFLIAFVLLAPWVGAIADRYPKPNILIIANLIKASGAFMSGKLKIEGDISTAINFAKKLNSQ